MRAALLVPLAAWLQAAQPTPRLLATAGDFERMERLAATAPWAAAVRSGIISSAENWPKAQVARYELGEWNLPPEGGQWTLWYVCPVHGVSLQFRAAGQNLCPIDGKNFTGWPFDQVIYSWRHSDNAAAARDNGLAYRLTGKMEYARAVARILLAYADVYGSYAIKDVNNRTANSGARVMAQTLDESVWLIPIAWAYDLIAESGALTAGERGHVEQDLLRAAVAVIQRNDAKQSNWQSWHNAAIGAVGLALEDAGLIQKAVDGPSGFRFQMRASVQGDGAWYEGAWGYHFYALDPLLQLAEMAARAGLDLYADRNLRRMFEAPLLMAMPDLTLPPFNDSGAVNLASYDRLYEMAWARYGDPVFTSVLGRRARGREALLWGAAELPDAAALPALGSAVFPDSGNAVLRAAGSDHYIAMKFGPHGGGHGHYDKLGMMSYARGGIMAVDPGTQSYAAPTHNTWDKVTLAHNTVVVDERTQAEATGRLLAFTALPAVSAVRADAGAAYKGVALERTLLLTADYALDVFEGRATDGATHRFDWIYHNNGKAATALALAPYAALPKSNGYQHLSGARAAATDEAWQANFDMNPENPAVGSIYLSPAQVGATQVYSREQSASGAYSARMQYDFSKAQGYIVFNTPTLTGQPREGPAGVSLMVYGDGSGHRLAIRLYDATDERFVFNVGTVNWTGWRQITSPDFKTWSHYLGNADGVFDGPVKTVAVELTSVAGGPVKGALYWDEVVLDYAGAGRLRAADFEMLSRGLRLWMRGAAGTTVVMGDGLGPDLRKPVPFAMARRSGNTARFTAMLEPYGDAPRVTDFRESDDQFIVAGEGWEDRVSFDASGVLRYVRREGSELRRAALAGAAALEDMITVENAVPVQVDWQEGAIAVQASGAGTLRVLAPQAGRVTVNGIDTSFQRDGTMVVFRVN